MKLSKFKEKIIANYGKSMWKAIEESVQYKIYTSTEDEQLERIKQNEYIIRYIKNPTEEMQLEAVKNDYITIKYINNPTDKVIEEVIKNNEGDYELAYLLHFIENDLKEDI